MFRAIPSPPEPMLGSDFVRWQWDAFLALRRAESNAPVLWQEEGGADLAQALCYVSLQEQALLECLLREGGAYPIAGWEACTAAQALEARGWAKIRVAGKESEVCLRPGFMETLPDAMMQAAGRRVDLRLFSLQAALHALLYLRGALQEAEALSLLSEHLEVPPLPIAKTLLWSAYDCVWFGEEVYLVHPALLCPEGLLAEGLPPLPKSLETTRLMGGVQGMLPEEQALANSQRNLLLQVGQDEEAAEELSMELRLLVKQGIAWRQVAALLKERLGRPVPRTLLTLLSEAFAKTPLWTGCGERGHGVQ